MTPERKAQINRLLAKFEDQQNVLEGKTMGPVRQYASVIVLYFFITKAGAALLTLGSCEQTAMFFPAYCSNARCPKPIRNRSEVLRSAV